MAMMQKSQIQQSGTQNTVQRRCTICSRCGHVSLRCPYKQGDATSFPIDVQLYMLQRRERRDRDAIVLETQQWEDSVGVQMVALRTANITLIGANVRISGVALVTVYPLPVSIAEETEDSMGLSISQEFRSVNDLDQRLAENVQHDADVNRLLFRNHTYELECRNSWERQLLLLLGFAAFFGISDDDCEEQNTSIGIDGEGRARAGVYRTWRVQWENCYTHFKDGVGELHAIVSLPSPSPVPTASYSWPAGAASETPNTADPEGVQIHRQDNPVLRTVASYTSSDSSLGYITPAPSPNPGYR